MIKPWQRFEQNFKKSCLKDGLWIYRLKDAPKDFNNPNPNISFSPSNTCDYIVYSHEIGFLFPTELKSFAGKSFPFSNMKEKHENKMVEWAENFKGVKPCILFDARDVGETYLVSISDYHAYRLSTDRKSINVQTLRDIGTLVVSKVLKVNKRYSVGQAYLSMTIS